MIFYAGLVAAAHIVCNELRRALVKPFIHVIARLAHPRGGLANRADDRPCAIDKVGPYEPICLVLTKVCPSAIAIEHHNIAHIGG